MTDVDSATFLDTARDAMLDSFLRMIENDIYEPPHPLFPLYEGIEVAQQVAFDPRLSERMRLWIDAAKELLEAALPRKPDVGTDE